MGYQSSLCGMMGLDRVTKPEKIVKIPQMTVPILGYTCISLVTDLHCQTVGLEHPVCSLAPTEEWG